MTTAQPASSTNTAFLPALYATTNPQTLPQLLARLSLLALHVERYAIRDDIYVPLSQLIPGPSRRLRLRTHSRKKVEEYELGYVSARLKGREYGGVDVRGYLGVEVVGKPSRDQVEAFTKGLGYR